MSSHASLDPQIDDVGGETPGATASFPYDRMTVERFRAAFPRARWRDDLRAWFVPGTTAGRRLDKWLGRELSGVLAYADEKGRDGFSFEPIESAYLEAGDQLIVRTPYSRTVVAELREVPWAAWDGEARAWRVPYRSIEALRKRWPAIELAARRNEPAARQARRLLSKAMGTDAEGQARNAERRRHRFPVPADSLPPADRVVMTQLYGTIIVTDITGELVQDDIRKRHYADVGIGCDPLVWATWRKPGHAELVKTWPASRSATESELRRGWWQPALPELRAERRKAASTERARATRQAKRLS